MYVCIDMVTFLALLVFLSTELPQIFIEAFHGPELNLGAVNQKANILTLWSSQFHWGREEADNKLYKQGIEFKKISSMGKKKQKRKQETKNRESRKMC